MANTGNDTAKLEKEIQDLQIRSAKLSTKCAKQQADVVKFTRRCAKVPTTSGKVVCGMYPLYKEWGAFETCSDASEAIKELQSKQQELAKLGKDK